MRLVDLNPKWLGYGGEGISDKDGNPVPARERVGIIFDCPCGCGRPLAITFTNPEDGLGPIDSRVNWTRVGNTFENLTLSPSIQRMDNCRWHGFIENGNSRTV